MRASELSCTPSGHHSGRFRSDLAGTRLSLSSLLHRSQIYSPEQSLYSGTPHTGALTPKAKFSMGKRSVWKPGPVASPSSWALSGGHFPLWTPVNSLRNKAGLNSLRNKAGFLGVLGSGLSYHSGDAIFRRKGRNNWQWIKITKTCGYSTALLFLFFTQITTIKVREVLFNFSLNYIKFKDLKPLAFLEI